jgi:hypothetical protein
MPDVSRAFLLILFPAQAALTVAGRILLRLVLERRRREGKNLRYVVVLGAGPRGQEFARKLEAHRELGLRIAGFLDDSTEFDLPAGGPCSVRSSSWRRFSTRASSTRWRSACRSRSGV